MEKSNGSAPGGESGKYCVIRGGAVLHGFGSFYEAYGHALNLFGDEGFTVWHEDWGPAPGKAGSG